MPKTVSIRPAWRTTSNRFTNLFAAAVRDAGWNVQEFAWSRKRLLGPQVVLLHWPDELYSARSPLEHAKAALKLGMLAAARRTGVRLVWLVHETRPHDIGRRSPWGTNAFLSLLDGAIYLSHASRSAAEADIPGLRSIPALVTRHGHYTGDMASAPTPRRLPGQTLNLIYFGQIRRYKNLDGLISAARHLDPAAARLTIVGWCKDARFGQTLHEMAKGSPAVRLDLRDRFLPQAELESALDASDGAVLPYRDILNSGAAMFALSRNRPVLAPRLGSLPELRAEIGSAWVTLYDGDIGPAALSAFIASLKRSAPPTPDLSAYDWSLIGQSVANFLDQLGAASPRASSSRWRQGVTQP